MQKLQDYWNERSSQQKMILVAAFVASFVIVTGFGWLASRPNMTLLYGSLDPATAGDVITRVEQAGVPYRVQGDSIWVAAGERDRLRMDLAGQGLPARGAAGYELLDGMSGFGTTSQMFDAAYWRAKEGELARTILVLPNVKTARVHLAVENGRGYRRDQAGNASVTVTTSGSAITRDQAAALKYLVSSGVPGMSPDNVTVIDSVTGIVPVGDDRTGLDRAATLKRNVERILESHVGAGNAIVELNLDLATESELLLEQRFDPDQRALISQVSEESTDQSNSLGSGAVTAASNLPDGNEAAADRSESSRSQARQQQNYEVSTLTREVTRQPGSTRRLTVAVLVNGVPQTGTDGERRVVPRPDTELQTLRELVASAVGLDEARGDQLTVKSLPFAALGETGTLARPGWLDRLELNGLLRILLVGLFAIAVVMMILRPLLRGRGQATLADMAALRAAMPVASSDSDASILPPEPQQRPEPVRPEQLSLPPADPVARLRGMMRERHEESVKVLSGWIDDKEKA